MRRPTRQPGLVLLLGAALCYGPSLTAGELQSALERLARSAAEFESDAGAAEDGSGENRAAARVAYLLGKRRAAAGDDDSARRLFETAAKLDPRPEHYVALAESYEKIAASSGVDGATHLAAAQAAYRMPSNRRAGNSATWMLARRSSTGAWASH